MSKKKKKKAQWRKWWEIKLYWPIGKIFKRRTFYVFAVGYSGAVRKLHSRYPNAEVLSVTQMEWK